MKGLARSHNLRSTIRALLVVPLVSVLALVAPVATAQPPAHPELTVMTRNIYLGSSLQPALEATTPVAFVGAVAKIYGTMVFTDFPKRASALAQEIVDTAPDLIGLQEVSNWDVIPLAAGPLPPAQDYDFLEILMLALEAKGLDYSVAGYVDNALIGPAPLVAAGTSCVNADPTGFVPTCLVTFADRDVILVNNKTSGLEVGQDRSGRYATQQVLTTPVGELSFDRGWVYVTGRYMGKSFKFVNTHLEVEGSPQVQEAQAREFLRGPARGGQTIAVGDFNSAADGSTTNSYAQLTSPSAFTDAWTVNGEDPGLTCCRDSALVGPAGPEPYALNSRIDLILTRGPIRALNAETVGVATFQGAPPLWASDHAGVVATVRLR